MTAQDDDVGALDHVQVPRSGLDAVPLRQLGATLRERLAYSDVIGRGEAGVEDAPDECLRHHATAYERYAHRFSRSW